MSLVVENTALVLTHTSADKRTLCWISLVEVSVFRVVLHASSGPPRTLRACVYRSRCESLIVNTFGSMKNCPTYLHKKPFYLPFLFLLLTRQNLAFSGVTGLLPQGDDLAYKRAIGSRIHEASPQTHLGLL